MALISEQSCGSKPEKWVLERKISGKWFAMCGSDWNRPKDYRRAVVIDKGPKKYDEREHSSEWMQKSVQKRFDRADVVRDVR
jgi:hypothetical protein